MAGRLDEAAKIVAHLAHHHQPHDAAPAADAPAATHDAAPTATHDAPIPSDPADRATGRVGTKVTAGAAEAPPLRVCERLAPSEPSSVCARLVAQQSAAHEDPIAPIAPVQR